MQKCLLKKCKWGGRLRQLIFNIKVHRASPQTRADVIREKLFYCGKNVELYTTYFGTEPYLISIHDNVTCAGNVRFVTHDVSCFNMARYLGISNKEIDKVGSIELFENSFVGAWTILMPNTSVGKNSVVAAGSVVTKHIPEGEVWGGCPAHFIMKTEEYAKKVYATSQQYPWLYEKDKMTTEQLISSRQQYFFKNLKY